MVRQHLLVEIAVDDQHRLLDLRHDLRRIEQEQAPEPRRVRLRAQLRRDRLPSLVGNHRRVDALLQLDLGLPLRLRRLHRVEQVPLLLEDELRAGRPRRRDQHERRDLFLARAASIATAPPSLCPATAIRFGSMSLRLASHFTAAMRSSA